MVDSIRLVSPSVIKPNPENPRLIFRSEELKELQESIADQGILVPLTVFADDETLVILDGERRWRCARALGLAQLPVIVQPKPSQIQNIMMMFAIHNTRREWDPLPTAKKLAQLEGLYRERQGRPPTEIELAQIASTTRGEVRRLKNMLALPKEYQDELMIEAEKPRSDQSITVDHVLEATRGSKALANRGVVTHEREAQLTEAIVDKFRRKVLTSTVEPRQLTRIARAVQRQELPVRQAARIVDRIITDPGYTVSQAFQDSVARLDYEHTLEAQTRRLTEKLAEEHGHEIGEKLFEALDELRVTIDSLLRARS